MSDHSLIDIASTLTLEHAGAISNATVAAGRKAGLLPLTVAVLDAGANLVHFQREDGCGTVRGDIAIGKAAAALGPEHGSGKAVDQFAVTEVRARRRRGGNRNQQRRQKNGAERPTNGQHD